jgi:serine protease Do
MRKNAVAWASLAVAAAALVGSRGYTRPLPAAQDIPAEGQQVAKALSDAFQAVAEYTAPSVVQINVEKRAEMPRGMNRRNPGNNNQGPRGPQGREMPQELQDRLREFFGGALPDGVEIVPQQFVDQGTGSGFVFDDKGHILTNAHVVNGADKIVVTFHDGVELPATIVGVNTETDVAVIHVDSTDYRPLKTGNSSDLRVGQWVLALGSPFGLDHTVTAGIVSATERQEVGINQFESFIQTDAAINPGNSGGPLVDLYGHVVGINSAIATASRSNSGVGFAIPINMATRIAGSLIKNGKVNEARMGVNIDPLTPKLARQLGLKPQSKGLLVTEVGKGTPAEQAGLKVGDIILSYDGQPVSSRSMLQYFVSTSDPGNPYPVEYIRDGQKATTRVEPAERAKVELAMGRAGEEIQRDGGRADEAQAEAPKAEAPKPHAGLADFGFEVAPLSPELAKQYRWKPDDKGVIVTKVDEDSPAAATGMEPGDRITMMIRDRKHVPVQSVDDLKDLAKDSGSIAVYLEDVRKVLPGEYKLLERPEPTDGDK